jgi:site-specific DNA-cytosine methylase
VGKTTTVVSLGHGLAIRGKNVLLVDVDPQGHVATAHSKSAMPRAFLVPGNNSGPDNRTAPRESGEPSTTVPANARGWRSWLSSGRVVKMTPRCLARFQTFPDWFELPDSSTLACKGLGNAVPPLLYQKLVKPLLG